MADGKATCLTPDQDIYYTHQDSLISVISTLAVIVVQYEQLLTFVSISSLEYDVSLGQMLVCLYNRAETTLHQAEAELESMDTAASQVLLGTLWSQSHDVIADRTSGDQFWSILGQDIQATFDIGLSFRSMAAYHAIALYWTAGMSLLLIISDMLALMISVKPRGMPADPLAKIEQHRIRLMSYTEKVLQSIVFVEIGENKRTTPFFLATALQMAIVALKRECETIRSEVGDDAGIRRVQGMKSLAERYMEWATKNKIPIRMNVNLPLWR